jgi:hypothetical protein
MEIIDVDGHVNDIADQGKVQIDSAEKPSVHPSRASGRTEEPLIFGDFSVHAEPVEAFLGFFSRIQIQA